ncbi:hypothetical protein ABH13_0189 [Bacillus velezensis]|jgi:hypothetical protein|uniref:Uncharacterized protein n=1 Tax=Bacillus amyloliquefaciens (strain Y2) TaxID=1155777 RepID=I2C0U8_BACAY|nr:hypothetical protein LL3_00182 [Bacillus amyloliquefaciens LL3]AEK87337.1 hypothetical protein BAXH7_00187 [Bacillus amyloliquefaciens XH7]AFJ60272.1 hypothetical protein MUS_0190 [Bacillus velezensis YAU B9601-Y2]AGZ54898.1 hypothetical protein U471_01820 [Bacillus amyloliquefaciens CC178]AKL74800.1 hypothetical protein ABH13_0189 [Bacillus velezensis]KYC87322.1 hypothetical protein B4140_0451 [Bacillus amyloliquefaciens]GFR56122.1 hypothetical protein LL3_00182 [Bacillus sp. CN2]
MEVIEFSADASRLIHLDHSRKDFFKPEGRLSEQREIT